MSALKVIFCGQKFEKLVFADNKLIPVEKAFRNTLSFMYNILRAANKYKEDSRAIPVSTTKELQEYKAYVNNIETVFNKLKTFTEPGVLASTIKNFPDFRLEPSTIDLNSVLKDINAITTMIDKSDSLSPQFKASFRNDYLGYRQQLSVLNNLSTSFLPTS